MKSTPVPLMLTLFFGTSFVMAQRGFTPANPPVNTDPPGVVVAKLCQSTVSAEYSMCAGYMSGFQLAIDAVDSRRGTREICFPEEKPGEMLGKLKAAFIAYVEKHPRDLNVHVGHVAYQAFLEAFPCKK